MKKHNLCIILTLCLFTLTVQSQTVLTGTIGKDFKITSPGVYQISGTVTGNIVVSPTSAGNITIEGIGENPILQGIPWGGSAIRSFSHYQGNAVGGTLTWRNLTVKGNGHNAMEGYSNTPKVFENIHVINYERTENGITYDNVGSINGGENSIIRNCYLETGDDAVKITESNSKAYNSRIRLIKNGAAIQLGWADRMSGANHIADTIEIRGQLTPNIQTQNNESTDPGRCIIAGIVQNNTSNISLTNLDIDVTNYKNLIKFLVQTGQTTNPTLSNVLISGKITDQSIFNVSPMKAISLVALGTSKIRNMVIDMGDKIADPQYLYIKGDVDVKFIKTDKTFVQYIGGVLQTTEINDTKAVQMNAYPNPFKDYIHVESSSQNVKIFDVSGRQLNINSEIGATQISLNTTDLKSGIYFIKFENKVVKLIKE